jgi:hypothetical protein
MDHILRTTAPEKFISPEQEDLTILPAPLQGIWQGGEKYIVDTISGKLATEHTPRETRAVIVVPEVHTILKWINKDNPRGAPPVNPQNDPQYTLWEEPVRAWIAKQSFLEGDRSGIPAEYDTVHTPESAPILSLSGSDFAVPHQKDERLSITTQSSGLYPLSRVELYINGTLIEKSAQQPFTISFIPQDVDATDSENEITIIAYDTVFNASTVSIKLRVQ